MHREGCGSSEWTGVRVLKGRRPVGRECSSGWNSALEEPIALWGEQGTASLRIPRHCAEPEENPFGWGWKECSGIPRAGGRKKMQAQTVPSLLAPHPQLHI